MWQQNIKIFILCIKKLIINYILLFSLKNLVFSLGYKLPRCGNSGGKVVFLCSYNVQKNSDVSSEYVIFERAD